MRVCAARAAAAMAGEGRIFSLLVAILTILAICIHPGRRKIKYIIVKIHAYKQLFDTIKLCHVHHYLFTLKRLCIAKLKIIFFRALLSYTNHRLAFCKKKTGPVTYMLLTGPVV